MQRRLPVDLNNCIFSNSIIVCESFSIYIVNSIDSIKYNFRDTNRHEPDQPFVVPVSVKKIILVPVPVKKKFGPGTTLPISGY